MAEEVGTCEYKITWKDRGRTVVDCRLGLIEADGTCQCSNKDDADYVVDAGNGATVAQKVNQELMEIFT